MKARADVARRAPGLAVLALLLVATGCAAGPGEPRTVDTIDGTIRDGVYIDWSRTFSIKVPHAGTRSMSSLRIVEDAGPNRVFVSFGPADDHADIYRAEITRLDGPRPADVDVQLVAQACVDDISARLTAGLGVKPLVTSATCDTFGAHQAWNWTLMQDTGPALYSHRVWLIDFVDALGVVTVQTTLPGGDDVDLPVEPELFARSLTMLARSADGIRDDEFTSARDLPDKRPQVPIEESTPAYPDAPPGDPRDRP